MWRLPRCSRHWSLFFRFALSWTSGVSLSPICVVYWVIGAAYLAVGITFEHIVVKAILHPGVDLWLFRCRDEPEEEETWSSLLIDVLKEPFWRTIAGYLKGMAREIVLLVCLAKAPLQLAHKTLPGNVFPLAVYPLTPDNQYFALVHVIDITIVLALLVAVLQTLPLKDFLRRHCYHFVANACHCIGLGTALLHPEAQLLYGDADEVAAPPAAPARPLAMFLRKIVLLLLCWTALLLLLTSAFILPVLVADAVFTARDALQDFVTSAWLRVLAPTDPQGPPPAVVVEARDELVANRRLDPLLHFLIFLTLIALPKLGGVTRCFGQFFYLLTAVVLYVVYYATAAVLGPVLGFWRRVSHFVACLTLHPAATVAATLHSLSQAAHDEMYLYGLRIRNAPPA